MAMQWTQDLLTGEPEVDAQHRELISRINRLLEACELGWSRDEVRRTLAYVGEYVQVHFSTEEGLMARHAFPELEAHRQQHRKFAEQVALLRSQLDAGGPTLPLVASVNKALVEWLREHVQVWDRAMAEYVRAHLTASPE